MSDELFAGLVGLGLGGIAYTAYNHHLLFQQHIGRVIAWVYALAAIMFSWNLSNWVATATLLKWIPRASRATANAVAEGLEIDQRFVLSALAFGVVAIAARQISQTFHKGA